MSTPDATASTLQATTATTTTGATPTSTPPVAFLDLSRALAPTDQDRRDLHERLVAAAGDRGLIDVAYRTLDTPIGPLLLAATDDGLVRIAFDAEDHDAVLEALAERISPRILRAPGRLDRVAAELDEYFDGRRRDFDLPLDWRLSHGFRLSVLRRLVDDVGYGRTATYSRLAELVGNARAVRAVGSACATNPLPVIVPCHRVVPPTAGWVATWAASTPSGCCSTSSGRREPPAGGGAGRVAGRGRRVCDWARIGAELDSCGGAPIGPLLHPPETDELVGLYDDPARFRSTVDMGAHRYGEGSYRYFAHPLPEAVRALREALYPRLVPVARDWWGVPVGRRRGRTTSTTGWISATTPARRGPPRCSSTTGPGVERPTATSTARRCSPSRW